MISVIIPIYNAKDYIMRCLDSLKNQSFMDVEFLLIDDGSSDGSETIIEKEEDNRFHVFHKENGGVASASNFGLDNAKGEWIMFVDSDDWVAPGFVKFPTTLRVKQRLIS